MILKYEKACKAACEDKKNPMTQNQVKKVRNYIDGQNKKLRKNKKKREEEGIVFNSLESLTESDEVGDATLGTRTEDPLEIIIRDQDMDRLSICLNHLSESDREIILTIYGCDPKKVNIKRASELLNMKRTTVSDNHKRILADLKKDFFKNY